MRKPEVTEGMKFTLDYIVAYLKGHGIPKSMINYIRRKLIYDSVTQGKNIQYDRIYTAIALMLNKEFGFGVKRITRGLRAFDDISASVLDDNPDNKDWTDLMEELRDRTGIVIRTGDNRTVVEMLTDDEKKNYKYSDRYSDGRPRRKKDEEET